MLDHVARTTVSELSSTIANLICSFDHVNDVMMVRGESTIVRCWIPALKLMSYLQTICDLVREVSIDVGTQVFSDWKTFKERSRSKHHRRPYE